MTIKEIDARLNELRNMSDEEINKRSADEINAITKEIADLEEERAKQMAEVEQRKAMLKNAAAGGTTVEKQNEERTEVKGYDSQEYKRAWLKEMARTSEGSYMFGAPDAEEREAFTHTTANTSAIVPLEIQNRIVELVVSQAPMYADATRTAIEKGFSVPRHVAIAAGDAAATSEGVANVDEQDTFNTLDLTGVEIKKHVVISRKMKFQSIDAFEDWIVKHIADRIAVAKEKRIIAQLDTTTAGIATANVMTGSTVVYDDATIRKIFAKIKAAGVKVVYANSTTIWNGLVGIVDGNGNKIFVPNSMVDPTTQGRIYGALVKENDNLADNVAYIGVPKSIIANDFDALFMNRAIDPKSFEEIISGYSLFDAGLENPLAFVKVTFHTA